MHRKQHQTTPSNITNVADKRSVPNQNSDIILYILIVVGASFLLLMIPLVSYVVQLSKRKLRMRRRRKQMEKANARRMAERDILEKMLNESRNDCESRHHLVINSSTEVLEIPPRISRTGTWKDAKPSQKMKDKKTKNNYEVSPIHHCPSPPNSLNSRSTVDIQKTGIGEAKTVIGYDINGFVSDKGLINRGYYSSSSILSIPLRKATSDLYLPRDPTLLYTAKRRFSEDVVGNGKRPAINDVHRKASLAQRKELDFKENEMQNIIEEGIHSEDQDARQDGNEAMRTDSNHEESSTFQPQNDNRERQSNEASIMLEQPVAENLPSNDSPCAEADCSVFDSDQDYDDVYEDIYENVDRNGSLRDTDGPIYDVVDGSYCNSHLEHIYSNVDDEISDDESHIYWNLDGLYGESTKSSEEGSEGDDYENLEFFYRNSVAGDSDSSSVSYENLDFLNGKENDIGEVRKQKEEETPPPIIPRRKPIPLETNKNADPCIDQ